MTNRKIVLAKLWNHFKFSLDSLPERIRLQKTIYLLMRLKYPKLSEFYSDYNLYIHGPYSSALAKDVYDLQESNQELLDNHKGGFSSGEQGIIGDFEKLFKNIKCKFAEVEDFIICELLSDIIYYYCNNLASNDDELYEKLRHRKSYFDDRELVFSSISILRTNSAI